MLKVQECDGFHDALTQLIGPHHLLAGLKHYFGLPSFHFISQKASIRYKDINLGSLLQRQKTDSDRSLSYLICHLRINIKSIILEKNVSLTLTIFKDRFSFPSKMINGHYVIVFPPGCCFPARPPPSLNHSPLCALYQAVEWKREKKNFCLPAPVSHRSKILATFSGRNGLMRSAAASLP